MRTSIEPLDPTGHLGMLHHWVTHPRSVYWQMQEADLAAVATEYRRIREDPHHHAFLGRVDGDPAFLTETYDPRHRELAGVPGIRAGDLGMHLLVAPPERERTGFTRLVMGAVLDFCFADPAIERVVVEPDVRNHRILALNAAAGFRVARRIRLAGKTAALSFCGRADFARSALAGPDRELAR